MGWAGVGGGNLWFRISGSRKYSAQIRAKLSRGQGTARVPSVCGACRVQEGESGC